MRKLSSLVLASGLISAMTVAQAAVTVYPDYPTRPSAPRRERGRRASCT